MGNKWGCDKDGLEGEGPASAVFLCAPSSPVLTHCPALPETRRSFLPLAWMPGWSRQVLETVIESGPTKGTFFRTGGFRALLTWNLGRGVHELRSQVIAVVLLMQVLRVALWGTKPVDKNMPSWLNLHSCLVLHSLTRGRFGVAGRIGTGS